LAWLGAEVTTEAVMVRLFSRSVSVGKEGRLAMPGEGEVPLAINKKAFKDFAKAAIAKDTYGMGELTASGKVFTATNGTRVLVIDTSKILISGRLARYDYTGTMIPASKVRLMEGPKANMAGWISSKWVK